MKTQILQSLLILNFVFLFLLSSCSCSKDEHLNPPPPVDTTDTTATQPPPPPVTPTELTFTTDGGGQLITITSFDKWSIEDPELTSSGICLLSSLTGSRGDKIQLEIKKHDSRIMRRIIMLNIYKDTLNAPVKDQIKIIILGKEEAYFNMTPVHYEYFQYGIPRRDNSNPKFPLLVGLITTNIDTCRVDIDDPSWISSLSWNCEHLKFDLSEYYTIFEAMVQPNNTGNTRTTIAHFRFKTLAGRDSVVSMPITQLGPSDAEVAEAIRNPQYSNEALNNEYFNTPLNKWTGVALNQQGYIEYMSVGVSNQVDNRRFRLLKQLKYLKRLQVEGSSTIDTIGRDLYTLDNIEELTLHHSKIKGITGQGLASMKNLKTFRVDNPYSLDKTWLSEYAQLKQIKRLIVNNNGLMGEIPQEIYTMTNLEELDLSDNNLEGTVSQAISGMTSLKLLDLEQNYFTGSLPQYILRKLIDPATKDNWKVGNQKGIGFDNIP